MKVLFIVSGNVKMMPYVEEQRVSLEKYGFEIDYFYIHGKGIIGYLKNIFILRKLLCKERYKLAHAHYGLAGLLASFQRKIPVVVTFHGSDINFKRNRIFSFLASRLCKFSIFVNGLMPRHIFVKNYFAVIPCGVDQSIFKSIDITVARNKLGLDLNKKYILFSSGFDNPVKNYPLARNAVSLLNHDVELLELKDYTREKVCYLLNACDLLLMTSFSEGSPQVIKEALFCSTPVVSTRVGDVPDLLSGVSGCYLADSNACDIAEKIDAVLSRSVRVSNDHLVQRLSLDSVAKKISEIYNSAVIVK